MAVVTAVRINIIHFSRPKGGLLHKCLSKSMMDKPERLA
jgi:hypothetical protein